VHRQRSGVPRPAFDCAQPGARAANTPEQLAGEMKREREVARNVVKDAGFEPQ